MSKEDDNDNKISDVIKKVVSIGVGAAFLTEDAVKSLLSDLPLPNNIVSGLIQNAKAAKEDFSNTIREEFKGHLSKLDMTKITEDILNKYDFEINAKIKLVPKDKDEK